MAQKKSMLLAILTIAVLVISGCTSSSKTQCKLDSDCASKTCYSSSCSEGKCSYAAKENCCGDKKKDATENNKPGNECTCPQDYGACEKTVRIGEGSKAYDAKYLQQYCSGERCILGVPQEKIRPITLIDDRDFKTFKLESTTTYNDPFDISEDGIAFRFTVTDDSQDIRFPIKLTKILLTDGDVVLGEKQADLFLDGVGDAETTSVPLSYVPKEKEEQHGLTFKISYEYNKRVKVKTLPNGTIEYRFDLTREEYEKKTTAKVTLFKTQ